MNKSDKNEYRPARGTPATLIRPDRALRAPSSATRYAVTDAADIAPYVTEERELFRGPLAAGAAAGLDGGGRRHLQARHRARGSRWCRRAAIPAWSAARPRTTAKWCVSLRRLDKIREIDTASNTMTCEAGVVLQIAQQRAAEADRLFPLSLGAEGSCTIGGNLSTNAGGTSGARLWRGARAGARRSKWCWPTGAF